MSADILRDLGNDAASIFGRSTHTQAPPHHVRWELRKMLGRHQRGGTWVQWDAGTRRFRKPAVCPDPIYDLYVARSNARKGPANAERYGAIRQAVVSPVMLPDMENGR